jgi:hypothetical protein
MTSRELNDAIEDALGREDLSIQGGKCIPFIGWFWRYVDFDAPSYSFGIMPSGVECGEPFEGFIGFMQKNKWDYGYTRETTPEEWAEIKRLLEVAVTNPTRETTMATWDYIQKLGAG